MATRMRVSLAALLLLGAAAAVNGAATNGANDDSACQAMADKLNARFMVGSSRFDAGGSTGQEARDKLMQWLENNGLLLSMCDPDGYPDVIG